jgi:hypothetical protein
VFLGLPVREAHLRPRLARQLEYASERPRDVLDSIVAEDGDGPSRPAQGSALRAAASRSSTAPARPASASQTKLSRFPAGPGSPEDA